LAGTVARHLRISGVVQGVGFRYWTAREAQRRGLRGWVRNRHDGSVEALIVGPAAAVEDMIRACAAGPRSAVVDHVEASPAEDDGNSSFRQLATE
jgi:acylphosphatase